MSMTPYSWNFVKSDEDYFYDTLKKFGDSLKEESDEIFLPIITITDHADDSRRYVFQIQIPELGGFVWSIFEVIVQKDNGKDYITVRPLDSSGKFAGGRGKESVIGFVQTIISDPKLQNELSSYYNKVVVKRKQNKDYGK